MARQGRASAQVEGDVSHPLQQKIVQRTAKVGVIGLGYVGMPLAVAAAQAGFPVVGIDIDGRKVEEVNAGRSYIGDVPTETLGQLVAEKRVTATSDYKAVKEMDVLVICVPTPVDKHREPDLEPLVSAVEMLARNCREGQLVVLQSTTFPGTTEEVVMPRLQRDGWQVGRDFFLAFSPERIDPGNPHYATHNIPKVVGGVTPQCCALASAFFSTFVERVIPVSTPKVAEMTKLLENIFRSVNIALVNELSMVASRMGVDIWEVVQAAATKPFGFMPFYPGIGVGGHCIPVDPFYLSWKAKEYDFYCSFIELAAKTNDDMPYYTVSRIVDILGSRKRPLKDARLLLLGCTFKRDVADWRNSPALRVADILARKGANITYHDRFVPAVSIGGQQLRSVELDEATLRVQDAAIILVGHSYYDLAAIVRHSGLVVDACNATGGMGAGAKVVRV